VGEIGEAADNLTASGDPALRGTFHMTGRGETSWAGFAAGILRLSVLLGGKPVTVDPIPTGAYPTPAKRPGNSRLDCDKLERLHGLRLPDWHRSTELVVRRLVAN
jgi:dTDP-4-dehydrorhamnose reductase